MSRQALEAAVRGLQAGEAPGHVKLEKRLWFVSPPHHNEFSKDFAAVVRQWCEERQINLTNARAMAVRDPRGGVVNVLSGTDAQGLYRQAHQERLAVLMIGGVRVQLDPSVQVSRNSSLSMPDYVANKALCVITGRPGELVRSLAQVEAWLNGNHCDGRADPRCLPRMMFTSAGPFDLSDVSAHQKFVLRHKISKKSASWKDDQKRDWECGAPHTRAALHVGGTCLPLGMHWDVSGKQDFILVNGWERWKVKRSGYVNVHPDGYIRGNKAIRTHPKR